MIRILLLSLLLALPALAGEADRQLEYAESELAHGDYAKALKSANSARRLDAMLHSAWVIKALAYEGLGQLEMAQAMLLAYVDERGPLEHDPRVDPALERIKEAQGGGDRPRQRKRPTPAATEPTAPDEHAHHDHKDPDVVRGEVETAIKAGKCELAFAEAEELRAARPDLSLSHWLVGNSHRCAGRHRQAVLALRRWAELGGNDPAGLTLLRAMADQLSVLVVKVEGTGAVVPRVLVHLQGETLEAKDRGEGFVFLDLPPESAPTIRVEGRGLATLEQAVDPLLPARRREVSVTPEYIGLAKLQLLDARAADIRVSIEHGGEAHLVGWGETHTVTAGDVVVTVSSPFGTVAVPQTLSPDSVHQFDATPWWPARATLVGLPSGSSVRIYVEAPDGQPLERELTLPATGGTIDPITGVSIAPEQHVDSLIGGSGGIFVEHPVLGEGTKELTLLPNSDLNATTFPWQTLEGIDEVRGRYELHQATRKKLVAKRDGGIAAGLAIAIGSGVASGVLFAAGQAEQTAAEATALEADAANLAYGRESNEFLNLKATYETGFANAERLYIAGSVTAGTAALGAVLTGVFGGAGQKAVKKHGDWEP